MTYSTFGLTLMVTHACNMRCRYCYTGEKAARRMPREVGAAAIRRAAASVKPGGRLELGFFGGEPLLEAPAIRRWMDLARQLAQEASLELRFQMTTNGTLTAEPAWDVMLQPDLRLALSFDGLPAVHDRFRILADGAGTSAIVRRTLDRLLAAGREFSVIIVVRPETLRQLPAGIRYLRALGVTSIEPSLDLWTHWTRDDAAALRRAIVEAAEIWAAGLPHFALNWFDEKAAELAHCRHQGARCGFGDGEIAVAPSGNLYPCERLIGEDQPDHPMRLPGHALDPLADFTLAAHAPGKDAEACRSCSMNDACNTTCRCSNYVRTGDVRRPDGLLCLLNQAALEEVSARVRRAPRPTPRTVHLSMR